MHFKSLHFHSFHFMPGQSVTAQSPQSCTLQKTACHSNYRY